MVQTYVSRNTHEGPLSQWNITRDNLEKEGEYNLARWDWSQPCEKVTIHLQRKERTRLFGTAAIKLWLLEKQIWEGNRERLLLFLGVIITLKFTMRKLRLRKGKTLRRKPLKSWRLPPNPLGKDPHEMQFQSQSGCKPSSAHMPFLLSLTLHQRLLESSDFCHSFFTKRIIKRHQKNSKRLRVKSFIYKFDFGY